MWIGRQELAECPVFRQNKRIEAYVTSAIHSGNDPERTLSADNWPQPYPASLAEVSEVAEETGQQQEYCFLSRTIIAELFAQVLKGNSLAVDRYCVR